MVRKAHYDFVDHTIVGKRSNQPRSFWSYAKLTRTELIGIKTHKTQTKQCTTDKGKSDTLNEKFLSVFIQERNMNVPDKEQSPFPDMPDLNISTAGVHKQLSSLNPTEAC